MLTRLDDAAFGFLCMGLVSIHFLGLRGDFWLSAGIAASMVVSAFVFVEVFRSNPWFFRIPALVGGLFLAFAAIWS